MWPAPPGAVGDGTVWGELAAIATAPALWFLAARLGLGPPARAAAVVVWAAGAGALALARAEPVDGRAALLLTVAALLAVGGGIRAAAAALAALAAMAVQPAVGVGVLVLVAGLAGSGDLGRRLPRAGRHALAAGSLVAAVLLAVVSGGGAGGVADDPPATSTVVAGLVAATWTLLVTVLLWRHLPWLRAVGGAAAAVLVVGGMASDSAVVLVGIAALGPLTAALVDEQPTLLGRRGVVLGALLVGTGAAVLAPPTTAPRPGPPVVAPSVAGPPPASGLQRAAPAVRPVALVIPSIGVDTSIADLGVDGASGELLAPDDAAVAGWFTGGPVPGDTGPAVLGGHVDRARSPGVFARLGSLRAGDRLVVVLSDGTAVRFEVRSVTSVPKDRFPTASVYGPTPRPELRLVTCGGRFDRALRSYRDNVVVEAVLVPSGDRLAQLGEGPTRQ